MNSENDSDRFLPGSFVRAHLVREPLYAESSDLWKTLLMEVEEITAYFRHLGLMLIVDEVEGFAYLRQIELESDEPVPRLIQRRKLTYDATLLLVCLRDEWSRFDSVAIDQARLYRTRAELHRLVSVFLRESNNQVRDTKKIDGALDQLCSLGFLRPVGASAPDSFEVRRIVKARFGAGELEAVKERLAAYGERGE